MARASGGMSVYEIAKKLQEDARNDAIRRLDNDINKLKGDISKAKFGRSGNESNLNKDQICQLDKDTHTNDTRGEDGPCTGKGGDKQDRFNIGKPWTTRTDANINHKDVLFPPRRLDMCTSNLENLDVNRTRGLKGSNVNDSFLGDVLLAAKYEGEFISRKLYDDTSSICNAMKYSFADIGDIIRGRDLWTENGEMKQLENKLIDIFKKIHEKDDNIKSKYSSLNNYKVLREDWWEANREQIWKAMTCITPDSAGLYTLNSKGEYQFYESKCGRDDPNFVPVDDYIPQKLRWMTEWSECYCKQLKTDYNFVKEQCEQCKNENSTKQCMNDNDKCHICSSMCEEYSRHVTTWKHHWITQKNKYQEFYYATNCSGSGGDAIHEKLEDFFVKLKNEGKPDYENVSEYVKSMRGNTYCIDAKQKDFNENNNNDNEYAFRSQPHEYENECKCKDRTPSNTPNPVLEGKLGKNVDLCTLSTDKSAINKDRGGHNQVSTNTLCGIHYGSGGTTSGSEKSGHKPWQCKDNKGNEKESPCVPPRVQEICLGYLDQNEIANKILNSNSSAASDEEKFKEINNNLLTEVLLTASLERNQLWELHKKAGSRRTKNSTACAEIVRSYHDLGDLIKGTNIWGNAKVAEVQLSKIFEKLYEFYNKMNNVTLYNKPILYKDVLEFRKGWWETNKNKIWDVMTKCVHNKCKDASTTAPDEKQQFLRWFNEWGVNTCIEHIMGLENLNKKCSNCNNKCDNINSTCNNINCNAECEKYKTWIDKRKKEWNILSQKYEANKSQYNNEDDDETFLETYLIPSTYLKFIYRDTCSKTVFKTLFETTNEYGDKQSICECSTTPSSSSSATHQTPDASIDTTDDPVDEAISTNPCAKLNTPSKISSCHQKNFDGVVWTSRNIRIDENGQPIRGVFAPPRRQKLCVGNIWLHATDKDTLLNELMFAANTEAKYLKKHYDEKNKGTHETTGKNDELCKALERSFYDLGDIVKGTDLRRGPFVERTEKKIYSIFKDEINGSGGTTTARESKILDERNNWWNQKKSKVWQAMTCENDCKDGINIGTDDEVPQFLRWFTEWSEDYCRNYKQYISKLKEACTSYECNNGSVKYNDAEKRENCEKECVLYKQFVERWRDQYKNQKTKYEADKKNKNLSYVGTEGKDAVSYIKEACSDEKCKCIIDNFNEENKWDNPMESLEGENKQIKTKCLCPQPKNTKNSACHDNNKPNNNVHPSDRTTKQMTCEDLKKDSLTTSNNCTKKNLMGEITKWELHAAEKYYIPIRRTDLCLDNIKNLANERSSISQNDITEEMFDQAIQKDAYNEAKNLLNYYNEYKVMQTKNGMSLSINNVKKYTIEAMKRSYADYGNLVQGTTEYKHFSGYENIKNMLTKVVHSNKIKLPRDVENYDQLWNKYKADVWNAMLCGYKDATSENKIDENMCMLPNNDKGNEFLRWLIEWGEMFCFHQEKKLKTLKEECSFDSCEKAMSEQKSKCQHECNKYKKDLQKWHGFYIKQYAKYDNIFDKFSEKKGKELHEFWKHNCDKKCECLHNRDNTTVNNVFNKLPKEIDVKCPCPVKISIPDEKIISVVHKKTDIVNPYDSLNICPARSNRECEHYGNDKCRKKTYDENTLWNSISLKNDDGKNTGVLIPPRKRYLCLKNYMKFYPSSQETKFKDSLFKGAAAEAKWLTEKYAADRDMSLYAIKYSFADIGNIIKGDDMMSDTLNEKIRINLKRFITKNKLKCNEKDYRLEWWEKNKTHVWHAMLCGFVKGGGTITYRDCMLPNEEKEDQFLRWLKEWGTQACKEKKSKASDVLEKCNISDLQELQKNNPSISIDCKNATDAYMQWIYNTRVSWKGLSNKYKNDKENKNDTIYTGIPYKTAKDYLDIRCDGCNCNLDDLDEVYNKDIVPEIDEIIKTIHKAKRDLPNGGWGIYWGEWKPPTWHEFQWPTIPIPEIIWNWIPSVDDVLKNVSDEIKKGVQSIDSVISKFSDTSNKSLNDAKRILDRVLELGKAIINTLENTEQKQDTPKPAPPKIEPEPNPRAATIPQQDEPSVPINNILSSTLPVGISFALGSIALLFYMKKLGPTNLFRVIDIPQNDYNIPTEKASNRYIPYGKYKGKTYIYMEGDEPDDYVRDISSSDITSSSESEYEEVNINDIYGYKSPKYKTLIEVVLKPSKNSNVQDTHDDTPYTQNVPPSDLHTNKWTEEEWNQMKDDFISQYLQNIPKDLPNENTIGNNMYKDIQPNIMDVNNDEKPFITKIQDRVLHDDSDVVSYNIDRNIPKQNDITNTITDYPKYVSNDLYSGIDLINDSLNHNHNVDIYDELLKRKENELFEAKHK
ncbi:erythrocyte membrane protein 1, PfEMP1, putative [Plasmodium sp. gorilla clade G2]|uniref:erythrocyte membrane protein 1, PfEMP1, putative n=1 Tax=Plasmodium sp. gorilla clade G2 TaxID=880535 RepID=UPI000D286DDB|nr:erythrocyte membrane protein 1, PfEMP1, putative [Plasmodium sp. gorilla clade G2]SOV20028.1 erythrocyte membrane protein 1, PfEMP1, putative [Plasmodium sp. gorilla clade G2]